MVNQETSQFSPVIFKPETNIKVLMNFSPRNWIVAMNRLVVLFSFQGYLYFTNIWACITNRTSGRKDRQILPWSQDWLCSEGGERWEIWARKNNCARHTCRPQGGIPLSRVTSSWLNIFLFFPPPFYSVKRSESHRSHNIYHTRDHTRLDSASPSTGPEKN